MTQSFEGFPAQPPAPTYDELAWQNDGLCRQIPAESFFPDTTKAADVTAEAKRICSMCDVTALCLVYALETNQEYGVWGGLSEKQRREYKRAYEPTASE